ncbi:MAG: fibro-slime domain-containing protein [Eubacteriales bacterium]|nr:fibro-slime domain-containing protein [Eubacteriales bacterium]
MPTQGAAPQEGQNTETAGQEAEFICTPEPTGTLGDGQESEDRTEPVTASVTTSQKYGTANKEALVFTTAYTGGSQEAAAAYRLTKEDGTEVFAQEGFSETITYMPTEPGTYTLTMTVTDADGQAVQAACTTPVSSGAEETADIWQASVADVTLTGSFGEDLVKIAETQLGIAENKENFIITEDGITKYYSRYGQWFGQTYEEWSAMFIAYCAEYTGIAKEYLPREWEYDKWLQALGTRYISPAGYDPQTGDLVFFTENLNGEGNSQIQEGSPSHAGIVVGKDDTKLYTIEGNSGGVVARREYNLDENRIAGYVSMEEIEKLAGAETEDQTEGESGIEAAPESTPAEGEEPEVEIIPESTPEAGPESGVSPEDLPAPGTEERRTLLITADEVIVRNAPTVEAEALGVVNEGTELSLLGEVESEGYLWYQVEYPAEQVLDVSKEPEAAEELVSLVPVDRETEGTPVPEEAVPVSGEEAAWEETAPSGEGAQMTEGYVRSDLADVKTAAEEALDTMTYEDDEVVITVSEAAEGAIPSNAYLQVVPIKKDDSETAEQYEITQQKLLEKAENEEYEIAGFLAYDITFVDENGVEMEPNDKVRVSIQYKQAAIPQEAKALQEEIAEEALETVEPQDLTFSESVSDDASTGESQLELTSSEAEEALQVSVMHLEETPEGSTQVVDMEENRQLETLELTENQEVQKTEFVTESFSTFTITWKRSNGTSPSVKVRLASYDENKEIVISDRQEGSLNEEFTSEGNIFNISGIKKGDRYYALSSTEGTSYIFQKGVIMEKGVYEDIVSNRGATFKTADAIEVDQVKSKDKKIKYHKKGDTSDAWYNMEDNDYLVFYYDSVTDLTEVPTVDHSALGITMRLQDHQNSANGLMNGIGKWENSGKVHQGLVKNKLSGGYPVLTGGTNLESLFQGKSVNHLFDKATYDATGYFEYSSFENYAYLGNNENFTVYDQIGTPKDEDQIFYKRGNFMPYNTIQKGIFSKNRNLYNEDGAKLSKSDARYNEKLYLAQGSLNYHFGMYMETKFIQPKDGIATKTKEPMIFEFNGDDDLWVFIDDVLVLDIGGEHDAHSGYINFQNGEVLVYVVTDKNTGVMTPEKTTIRQMYKSTNIFPDGSPWDDKNADLYFEGETFKDYTSHTLKMFYMERGAGASNLHIKFNLETVPDGQFRVTKTLSNTDKEKYTQEEFKFQVYLQPEVEGGDGNLFDDKAELDEYELLVPTAENGITVTLDGTSPQEKVVFQDETIGGTEYKNVFTLKPDQTAIFEGIKENRKYYVKEIGVNPQQYDEVQIGSTIVSYYDENDHLLGQLQSATSGVQTIASGGYNVVFTNNCSAANSRELRVTKRIGEGIDPKETFDFQIMLEGQDGNLTEYNGNYYLYKIGADNEKVYYYYDEHGDLKLSEESIACTTKDGKIEGVPADFTFAITQILSETTYKVTEVNLNKERYLWPTYEITSGKSENASVVEGENGSASGEIVLGQNTEITVTNRLKVQEVEILKYGAEENGVRSLLKGAEFQLYGSARNEDGSYTKGSEPIKTVTTGEDGVIYEGSLSLGWYYLTEIKAPVGHMLLGSDIVFEVTENGVTLTEGTSGENAECISEADGTYVVKVYNTKLYALPSTGGMGTYLFTISGVAILMSALLLFIQNKRKEDKGYGM